MMRREKLRNNVISLNKKQIQNDDYTSKAVNTNLPEKTSIISVTSGKGGVGKTNIVAGLGYALDQLGKKVLILDADLGLGNLDILLGLAPKYNLSHVIDGKEPISNIIVKGPGNSLILPAASGIQELTSLDKKQQDRIFTELDFLIGSIDILLIDTAAGISSNVMYFNAGANEIIVVATPEPTSITDAYALMKILSMKYSKRHFKLLINMASNKREAYQVYNHLSLVADTFLGITIDYFGYIISDTHVPRGVKRQEIFNKIYPDCQASKCIIDLSRKICDKRATRSINYKSKSFWKNLIYNKFD